jgi:two-component system sensor histidine kinase PilS (NtrC family)
MTAKSIPQNKSDHGLRRLMLLRLIVVTFLLGIAAFIQVKSSQALQTEIFAPIYSIIIATYVLSLLYILFLKVIKNLSINIYIQGVCDVTIITVLVYVTGGINSVHSALYNLVIIYSTLFLARRGGLIIASASSLFFGFLIALNYYRVFPLYGAAADYSFGAGYVLSKVFIHIASFFIVALLVSFVVEQEKRSRSLLTEKETEFDQLDLLYKSIIEHVNAGIVTVDLKGRIKSFNRTAEEICGYLFSQVDGKPIDSIFPGFSETREKMRKKQREDEPIKRGEIVISDRQDNDIVLGFSDSYLMSSRGDRIGDIVIFQNLTATKDMEKEVEKSKNLALIGEMAAGLAHEIRNPLTALSGSIQLLKRNLDLDKTDTRLMEIVLRGREQLENLISNFLLLARPMVADREDIDTNDIVKDVVETLRYGQDWHESIKVEMDFCDRADMYGNRTEVKQMLWNLVLNAVQAMPEGGELNIATSVIPSDNGEEYLEVSIIDTGCGIEKDQESKVFTPFYTTKERGTGLGLAIANRIVESHMGKLKLESEEGTGTICKILFPQSNSSPRKNTEHHGNLKNGKVVV